MKFLILILFLNTLTFSMDEDNYDKFLKENKKRHELMQKMYRVFTCTPFRETGILWGVNKIIGGKPISLSVQKTNKSSITINQLKINKVGYGRYENHNERVYLKDYSSLYSPDDTYSFNINTISIETQNKTTWYNCIFTKEEIHQ